MWGWYRSRFEPTRFTLARTRFPVYGLDRPGEFGGFAAAGTRWRMPIVGLSFAYGEIVVRTEVTDDPDQELTHALVGRIWNGGVLSGEHAYELANGAERRPFVLVCEGAPRPALAITSGTSRAALLTLASRSGRRLAVTVAGPVDAFGGLELVRLRS
jgi:hypothetical protein